MPGQWVRVIPGQQLGVPPPVDLPAGHRLLFGAIDPSGARRSATWMVKGKKNTRDLYVGTRDMMRTTKVSIHASGVVRFARTLQHANLTGAKGDRLLERFHPSTSPDGWSLKLQIAVPYASLVDRPAMVGREAPTSWWPTPGPGTAMVFRVFTTTTDSADQAGQLFEAVGHVGVMLLPGGGSVWVIVDAVLTDADFELGTAAHRADAQREHEAAGLSRPGLEPVQAWGQVDGVPLVIDMGGFVAAPNRCAEKEEDHPDDV